MDCDKCGSCCESYIGITPDEYENILIKYKHLNIDIEAAAIDYGYMIVFWKCPFLSNDNLCLINNRKPIICKIFPFVINDDGVLSVTTECHNFKTVTKKDFSEAMRLAAIENGRAKKARTRHVRKHGFQEFKRQRAIFKKDLKDFLERSEGKKCLHLPAKEFFKN